MLGIVEEEKQTRWRHMIEVKEFKTTDERANHMFQYRVVK